MVLHGLTMIQSFQVSDYILLSGGLYDAVDG